MRGKCLQSGAGSVVRAAWNIYGASACTANRLDGDGNLLSDEFPVRVQQSTAGAGN